MSSPSGTLTGREVAGYRLLYVLGTGGASEVYLAQSVADPAALVAMKVLMPSWQLSTEGSKNFHARFLREAQTSQRLQHPHILPVLALGEDDGVTYMVLPFMPGGTLATLLANAPQGLPLVEVARCLDQLVGALDFAHAQGIIHRDIKPNNILVDAQGQLFLADFGIARLFDPTEGEAPLAGSQPPTTLTVSGQMLGTPAYMAPEQMMSARVGPAADIYALGIVLYQMVTGALPFHGETPMGVAMRHAQEPPAVPSLRRTDLPAPAEAAMLKALAKAPGARFTSASALARAFAAGLRGEWTEGLAPVAGAHPDTMTAPTVAAAPTPAAIRAPTAPSAVPAPTVAVTPAPTIVTTPAPYPPGAPPFVAPPYAGTPYAGTPYAGTPYAVTPGPYSAPVRRRSGGPVALIAIVAIVAIVAAYIGVQMGLHPTASGNAKNLPSTNLAPGTIPTITAAAGTASYCMHIPGFSDQAHAASAGATYSDMLFPPNSVSYLYQTFNDGNYQFQLYNVCTDAATPDQVRAFYASNLPSAGWAQSATYPYQGNSSRACGDPYCWVNGSSPTRYASLEQVGANGPATVYQLRLGLLP